MKKLCFAILLLISSALNSSENGDFLRHHFTVPALPESEQIFKESKVKIKAIYPSFFFVEEEGRLLQLAWAELEGRSYSKEQVEIKAIRPDGEIYSNHFQLGGGSLSPVIKIPDQREKGKLILELVISGNPVQRLVFNWSPARLWKVFIVFLSHLDIGYTDTQEKVFIKRDKILERVLEYARRTQDWEKENQFRWTVEGSYTIIHFLKTHPDRLEELRRLAREDRLEICAKLMHLHSPTAGYEELFREIYPSLRELEPLLGGKVETVMHNDVPGFTWGEVSVMSSAGVHYFSFNPNLTYRGGAVVNASDTPQAFYWQGRDGGELLVWRSHSYHEAPYLFFGLKKTLPGIINLLQAYEKEGYKYDALQLVRSGFDHYIYTDNAYPRFSALETIRSWNQRFAYPKLISATPKMFFHYLEENFPDKIPKLAGDMPDWWADGVITEAKDEALSRDLHHWLGELELFSSLLSIVEPDWSYPKKEIDLAYLKNLFFDEHTWGYSNTFLPRHNKIYQTKAGWLKEASDITLKKRKETLKELAELVAGKVPSLVVFNPLSWKRSDLVEFELSEDWLREHKYPGLKIIDARSNEQIPFQLEKLASGLVKIYFIARDVPPVGYKTYLILPAEKPLNFPSPFLLNDCEQEKSISNEHIILRFGKDGYLESIKDKKLNLELSEGKIAEFIARRQDPYDLIDQRASGKVNSLKLSQDVVFARAKLEISDPFNPRAQLIQEIRLYAGLKWIDIINHYTRYQNQLCQARYFAFPFAMDDFELWLETPYARMRPYYDQLDGFAKYYALAHSVELKSKKGNYRIIWSSRQAPMVELGNITKKAGYFIFKPEPYPYNPSKPWIFSEIMNNYQNTNFSPSQKGSGVWQYRIEITEKTEERGVKSGWELAEPLIAQLVDTARGKFPPSGSFLELKPSSVLLTCWKRAEDGEGYIFRFYQTSSRSDQVRVFFPIFRIRRAWIVDGVERKKKELTLSSSRELVFKIAPYQIITIKLSIE